MVKNTNSLARLNSTRLNKYSKHLSKILVLDSRLSGITWGAFLKVHIQIIDEAGNFFSNSKARLSNLPNLDS